MTSHHDMLHIIGSHTYLDKNQCVGQRAVEFSCVSEACGS